MIHDDDLLSRELNASVKQLVSSKVANIVQDTLHDIWLVPYHEAQCSILLAIHTVFQHVIWDLHRKL